MRWGIVIVLLLTTSAVAQQTLEERTGAQLGALMIQNNGLQIRVEQLQKALEAAQTRVKELEGKYEPKEKK